MKRNGAGYTILEVMIFLAVTGVLFALIYPSISSRQDKVKFNQSVNDLKSKIDDVINDVSTGYFPSQDFTCTINSSGALQLTSGTSNGQGTRSDCIFLGKALRFTNVTDDSQMNIYTVIGKRKKGVDDVTKYTDAQPTIVAPDNPSGASRPDITENYAIKWQYQIPRVVILKNPSLATDQDIGSLEMLTPLSTSNNLGSDTKRVDIIPVDNSLLSQTSNSDAVHVINSNSPWDNVNPQNGILICIVDRGKNQWAAIQIGGKAGVAKTRTIFDLSNIESEFGAGVCGS